MSFQDVHRINNGGLACMGVKDIAAKHVGRHDAGATRGALLGSLHHETAAHTGSLAGCSSAGDEQRSARHQQNLEEGFCE